MFLCLSLSMLSHIVHLRQSNIVAELVVVVPDRLLRVHDFVDKIAIARGLAVAPRFAPLGVVILQPFVIGQHLLELVVQSAGVAVFVEQRTQNFGNVVHDER